MLKNRWIRINAGIWRYKQDQITSIDSITTQRKELAQIVLNSTECTS